jgi:hypothetical protein
MNELTHTCDGGQRSHSGPLRAGIRPSLLLDIDELLVESSLFGGKRLGDSYLNANDVVPSTTFSYSLSALSAEPNLSCMLTR